MKKKRVTNRSFLPRLRLNLLLIQSNPKPPLCLLQLLQILVLVLKKQKHLLRKLEDEEVGGSQSERYGF